MARTPSVGSHPGAALQATRLLIAPHRHERVLDRGNRILTFAFHVCHPHIPTDRRPLGFWLRAIDGRLRESMRGAFATFGVTRREWRVLATLHAGPSTVADLEVALPPRREHGPHGHGPRGRSLEQLLDGFVQRGWASSDRGGFALTAEGERIHDAVLANVQKVRMRVTAGIPDADYATTMSTLEKIAGNVGWEPGQRPMRRRGPRGQRPSA